MKRRTLIRSGFSLIGFVAANPLIRAAQQCGPIFAAPTFPPHGMQQCTAGIPSIQFKQAFQQMNEWCWAACISMVFEYHGHPVAQNRIVGETWGTVANMPGQPIDILRDLNRQWTDDNGSSFSCAGDILSTNAATAVLDLQADQPLIIGALGHATVLTALTSVVDLMTNQWEVIQALVRDPWPGNGGRRVLSPQEWYSITFAARIRTT